MTFINSIEWRHRGGESLNPHTDTKCFTFSTILTRGAFFFYIDVDQIHIHLVKGLFIDVDQIHIYLVKGLSNFY